MLSAGFSFVLSLAIHGSCMAFDYRILREYLKEETHVEDISGVYDLERVIDDFVLLCVLVGNDFLPHSPTLDINEGAMDEIFDCYRDMLRTKGGYLTYGEGISHVRLEFFLTQVARRESDTLKQRAQVWMRHLTEIA